MKKDDLCGAIGAVLCGLVGTYDADWRVFWYACGAGLAAWTVWSLLKPQPCE